jgi:hypothetical protein
MRAYSSQATSNDYTQVMQQAYEISKAPKAAAAEIGYTSGVPLSTYTRKVRDHSEP